MTEREVFIALCSNDRLRRCDAVVFLEGDGLSRIAKVLELYSNCWATKVIFSGGMSDHENGSLPYEFIAPELLKFVKEDDVFVEGESKNTREQAENVIELCGKMNWKSLILVASHYHQYRAFLTFLKVLIERDISNALVIVNASANQLDWFSHEPKKKSRYDLLYNEFEKIDLYSSKGHIASFKEAISYFQWKEGFQL